MHHYTDLIKIFESCFLSSHQTQLIPFHPEPIYLPASAERAKHQIFFAHDYFSSALHECAHWLIAGKARRQLIDYGYWYAADGRTTQEQKEFLKVEIKPQAMEWILSMAALYPFRISLDNLYGKENKYDQMIFMKSVREAVIDYQRKGLPKRAAKFFSALKAFYQKKCIL